MLKTFLLWLLRDAIIDIAAHEASKIVGVMWHPYTPDGPTITKVYLRKGDRQIFINDFTVRGREHEDISAPVTIEIGDEVFTGTANFKVTHANGEELENYKGDLLEATVTEDGVLEVTDFVPAKAVETPDPEPIEELPKARKARAAKYDREAVKQDFRDGYSTREVAARHSISYPTAAKIRKDIDFVAEKPVVTLPENFGQMREVGPETNIDGEIKLLFLQGFKLDEVAAMYPMVEMTKLVKLKSDARA